MTEPLIPLTQLAEEAAPGTFASAMPSDVLPQLRNLAKDEKVLRFIEAELVGLIQQTRIDRASLDEEWAEIRRMEMLRHDNNQKYQGKSNAYVPVYNRILNTLTSNLSRGLFPSDEYMDVFDRAEKEQNRAKNVKAYMKWEFERIGKVRQNIKPFLRQFTNYGTSVLKFWYNKSAKYGGKLNTPSQVARFLRPPQSRGNGLCMDGLAVSTRSMFNWYIYPLTCAGLDDATLVFEDTNVPRMYIEKMAREKRWVNVEAAMSAYEVYARAAKDEQLTDTANLVDTASDNGGALGDMRVITEAWTFMVLPRDQYLPDEDPEAPLPVRVILAAGVPVEVTRNPFWHQRPPYLLGRQNTAPGLVYGIGFGRAVRAMQYLTNDFMNQVNDCAMYTLNPVVKANPSKLAGPLRPIAPGVIWYMTEMDGVDMLRPEGELIQYGMQMVNTVVGMAQDFGGAPPVLQGSGASKGAKTATGAQILQRNALAPLQDVVEDLELDVMIPLLHGAWVNAQQYREEDIMAMVGGEPLKISPDMLRIDAEFTWAASSQAANQQQRAQQAMQLIQAVANPAVMQSLAQQGKVVNFDAIVRRIYSDGMGMRNYEDFIQPAQVMQGQMGMPSPEQMQGVVAEQGDRVRSALDQVAGAGQEMVPGEGGDFMEMRAGADDMAGDMGGNNGQV